MKTSPELLSDILGVLVKINANISSDNTKKGTSEKVGGLGTMGAIGILATKGKRAGAGVESLADSVKKLNHELDKTNIKKLNSLIDAIHRYDKLPKKTPVKEKVSNMAKSAKDISLALLYTAGGVAAFALTFGLAQKALGMSPMEILGYILLTSLTLGASVLILNGAETLSDMMIGNKKQKGLKGSKKDKSGKSAAENAKDMGLALLTMSGGVLAFSLSLRLIQAVFKTNTVLGALGIVALSVTGMAGLIAILGLAAPFIEPGVKTAKGIGIALAVLSLGIFTIALTSKLITGMTDTTATKKDGRPKGKFGQIMAGIGAGLGVFGMFLLGAVGLFWAIGLPIVAGPVLLGSLTMIMVSVSLLSLCKTVKKINETVNELGGTKGILNTSENIRLMVSGIMSGVINGVMGSGIDKPGAHGESPDGNLSLRELRQFRRVTKAIRMLGTIATSISRLARGLRAFAKLGEIASLDYEEDANGNLKPKISSEKIHVVEIAKTISDTFSLFITSLVKSTDGVSKKQAKVIKKLGKALGGKGGLISAVNDFAQTLSIYARFGKEKKMIVPTYDADGNLIVPEKGKEQFVTLSEIVENINSSFLAFVDKLAEKAPALENLSINKLKRFNEALLGQKRGFLGLKRERPGLIEAITSFSDVLVQYAQYGREGTVPIKDADGRIIDKMSMSDVASQIVNSISSFVSGFETASANAGIEAKASQIKDKVSSVISVISQFDALANSQEGIDKLANSIGLLATNIGLLVTNTSALDTVKLNALATTTAQHAVATKGVVIQHQPQTSAVTSSSAVAAQPDWDKLADMIGTKIAEKIQLGRNFTFTFYDGNKSGNLEIK